MKKRPGALSASGLFLFRILVVLTTFAEVPEGFAGSFCHIEDQCTACGDSGFAQHDQRQDLAQPHWRTCLPAGEV